MTYLLRCVHCAVTAAASITCNGNYHSDEKRLCNKCEKRAMETYGSFQLHSNETDPKANI